ncbi:MAG: AAA family ATPase [Clostridia bacterium]|jgi:superfamily I DNA and/or RNA helicase|nr:AAA family ATPase [Clostridia bacterium]
MELKLGYYSDIKNRDLLDVVNDGKSHTIKFTTNKLEIEFDRKDERYIKSINNVKMVFKMREGGCLILIGNLGCDFRQPVGGMFFCKRSYIDQNADYDNITGVETDVVFSNHPETIDRMQKKLEDLKNMPNFVFNLSQFDEFMEIFTFYKQLSSELNNNTTYKIKSVSDKYYYVPVDVKDIEIDETNQMTNLNGIVIGYKIEKYKYEILSSDQQDKVRELVDIKIEINEKDGEIEKAIKKIKRFSNDIFLTESQEIDDKFAKNLTNFDLVNIQKDKDSLIISGEINTKTNEKYNFVNLYDMGQKVKLESIDNSLRLINQGASGSACELLEYIIGSKEIPSNYSERTYDDNKDKYIAGLDESQKQAFLMATDGSPISLIKGPPGTGKTYVINAIVQYITKELKQKVVISSQTHVAIDNVLDALMEYYDLIIPKRITNRRNRYSSEEIDSTLYKTWTKKFSSHNERATDKQLANKIMDDVKRFKGEKLFRFSQETAVSEYSVLGATTTTSAIGGKKGLELLKGYDWLIIDEISKCPITEVLRYLPYVEKIIMVGDDFQLAPLLEFTKEEVKDLPSYDEDKFDKLESVYQQSVFANTLEKAKKAGRMIELNVNYRSVKDVLKAYNIFYGGRLQNQREAVKPTKTQFNDDEKYEGKDVFFVEVKNGKEVKEGTSRYNVEELEATADILEDLMVTVVNPINVSVSAIFPYAAQIDKFQKKYKGLINSAKKHFKSFEIDTVDAFQGRETDIVLVNTVVTTSQGNFLNDFRRINVSMSRARDKLFVFGNSIALSKIEMSINGGSKRRFFKEIIEDIGRFGKKIEYKGGLNYGSSKSKIEID